MEAENIFREIMNSASNEIKKENPYLLASEKMILIMLIQDKITHYSKSIIARLRLSAGNRYCCRIRGVAIYNSNNFLDKVAAKRKMYLPNQK